MTNDELAAIARQKKNDFIAARSCGANFDELKRLASEYGEAIAAWHAQRFPGKRFIKPSVSYLIRAL